MTLKKSHSVKSIAAKAHLLRHLQITICMKKLKKSYFKLIIMLILMSISCHHAVSFFFFDGFCDKVQTGLISDQTEIGTFKTNKAITFEEIKNK